MKKILATLVFACFSVAPAVAQYAQGALGTSVLGLVLSNQFSKDESLYKAKDFAMQQILGVKDSPEKFEMWALAAATSGELTSLVYKCEAQKKEGLLLAFYGSYWNEAGVVHQGYAFKNLPKAKAVEFLTKVDETIEANKDYLWADRDNNNVCFKYDDLTILLCVSTQSGTRIRVFWGQFDSDWDGNSFSKTIKRMAKKI